MPCNNIHLILLGKILIEKFPSTDIHRYMRKMWEYLTCRTSISLLLIMKQSNIIEENVMLVNTNEKTIKGS